MRPLDHRLQRQRLDRAYRHIGPGTSVLDIGCHQAELGAALRAQGCAYHGIDPQLHTAADGAVRGRFPEDMPVEWDGQRYDHVVVLAVLEHVPEFELGPFLAAITGRLTPSGTLIASVPSPHTDRILHALLRLRLIDGMDLEAHDGLIPRQLMSAAEGAGLRLQRRERFQFGLNNIFVWSKAT